MSCTESNDRPKWLLELENRKRKPRLAHEAGAGAPCVICKAACPGLDLHFWRKICKNCKCNKDDHDVDDEDFPQFDLLFGSLRKYKKKPTLLHINNEKGFAEEAFEWVPPDTTKELATDYMKALPVEKLPIKGSTGAALRRQLLQKQLPLHDVDYKVCDALSEQEKKEFEKYLENIKKYVGQGMVTKILSARPFDRSLMTPANATDMQRFSPQHRINAQSTAVQLRTPSSFTPKSSYKKDPYESLKKHNLPSEILNNFNHTKNVPILEKYKLPGNSDKTVTSESVRNVLYCKGIDPISFPKTSNFHPVARKEDAPIVINRSDNLLGASPSNLVEHYTESNADKEKSSPFACTVHPNEIIGSTLDEKGLMFIREKLMSKYSKQEIHDVPYDAPSFSKDLNSSNLLTKNDGALTQNVHNSVTDKTSVPATITNQFETLNVSEDEINREAEKRISEPMPIKAEKEIIKSTPQLLRSTACNLVPICNMDEKEKLKGNALLDLDSKVTNNSPVKNSSASLTRVPRYPDRTEINSFVTPSTVIYSEQLQNQVFPYEATGTLNEPIQNLPDIEHLKDGTKELSMKDVVESQKCHKCEEEIRVGDVAITTGKTKNAVWHPGCFVCNMCNELLVDLVYFYYKNKLYCGRDLATLLGIPRCFACDELIFVREYTVAEGHNYHVKHFCCWDCDVPLAGKQYITENDRPLCLPCYQKAYAKTCDLCEKVIAADQQGVAVKDLNFHATELCFCCYICKKNLLHGKIAMKEKKLFCSKECISRFTRV